MTLTIRWRNATVAEVTEHRWWWPDRVYVVALYGGSLWVRDDSNRPVSARVQHELDRRSLTL